MASNWFSETWIINNQPTISNSITSTIIFESNGKNYAKIYIHNQSKFDKLIRYYYNPDDAPNNIYIKDVSGETWMSEAYRTVTFLEEPTGDLLTWLQANAVKQ